MVLTPLKRHSSNQDCYKKAYNLLKKRYEYSVFKRFALTAIQTETIALRAPKTGTLLAIPLHMKPLLYIIALLLAATPLHAQEDTLYTVRLNTVNVNADRRWDNDTVRYRYNQLKYNVKQILPYLNEGTRLFNGINAHLAGANLSKRERKLYVQQQEAAIRSKLEEPVSKLNETQGVLLVKLLARQTGQNIYAMIDEFKGRIPAIKWQGWARLHGFNLNKTYDPNDEPMLEHVMESLGYPLPARYGELRVQPNAMGKK